MKLLCLRGVWVSESSKYRWLLLSFRFFKFKHSLFNQNIRFFRIHGFFCSDIEYEINRQLAYLYHKFATACICCWCLICRHCHRRHRPVIAHRFMRRIKTRQTDMKLCVYCIQYTNICNEILCILLYEGAYRNTFM